MEYLWSYARHFDLFKCIKFEHRVVGIEYVGPKEEEIVAWQSWAGNGEAFGGGRGEWHVTVEHGGTVEVWIYFLLLSCINCFFVFLSFPIFSLFVSLKIVFTTLICAVSWRPVVSFKFELKIVWIICSVHWELNWLRKKKLLQTIIIVYAIE